MLLPILRSLVDILLPIIDATRDWIEQHPQLATGLTIAAGAIGIFMLAAGGLLMALPSLIGGIAAFNVALIALAANPAFWPVIAAIVGGTAIVAGGIIGYNYFSNRGSAPSSSSGSVTNVNVNVEGSVTSENDLVSKIRASMLYEKSRNFNAGLA
jgi:hypothetical protein